MRQARYRKPVRDPIAGILSDWFGVENGSAKMLWALYQAHGPLGIPEIARRATLSHSSVTQCAGRLRHAGVTFPSQRGKRSPRYQLTEQSRIEVREALSHALRLLGRDIPTTDQLEASLAEFRGDPDEKRFHNRIARLRDQFQILPCCAHILLLLLKNEAYVSVQRLNAILPSHSLDSWDADPDPNRIKVMIRYIRRALGNTSVETLYGFGYRLTEEGREKVQTALREEWKLAA